MPAPDKTNDAPTSPAAFTETHWSVVLRAGDGSSTEARAALDQLCRTYWLPIYAYVRRRGHSPEDAQDLTQEFLASLISRRDFARVDRGKGKFRSFLLGCLNHFLANDWRDRHARKRGGGQTFLALDAALAEERLSSDSLSPPHGPRAVRGRVSRRCVGSSAASGTGGAAAVERRRAARLGDHLP